MEGMNDDNDDDDDDDDDDDALPRNRYLVFANLTAFLNLRKVRVSTFLYDSWSAGSYSLSQKFVLWVYFFAAQHYILYTIRLT